jgi:hypothetical protein
MTPAARAVLDNHGLLQSAFEMRLDQPRRDVVQATGRLRHNDADGLAGKILRWRCGRGECKRSGDDRQYREHPAQCPAFHVQSAFRCDAKFCRHWDQAGIVRHSVTGS